MVNCLWRFLIVGIKYPSKRIWIAVNYQPPFVRKRLLGHQRQSCLLIRRCGKKKTPQVNYDLDNMENSTNTNTGFRSTEMYQLFQEGMCRIRLRALRDWLNLLSSNTKADLEQLASVPEENRCLHLVAKLLGSGSRFMLHLLLQNISDQVIDSLTIMLQVIDGKLVLERSSAKISLMLPTSQHWIKINIRDPTSQGGEVSVIVRKDVEPDCELTVWGSVVCAAKISISPTIWMYAHSKIETHGSDSTGFNANTRLVDKISPSYGNMNTTKFSFQ